LISSYKRNINFLFNFWRKDIIVIFTFISFFFVICLDFSQFEYNSYAEIFSNFNRGSISKYWFIETLAESHEPLGTDKNPIVVKETLSPTLVALGVAAIIAAIVIYFVQQANEKRETIRRSTESILKEITDNKKAFSKIHQRVGYVIGQHEGNQKEVNYLNAYLESEAYQSIIGSGFFTHFCIDTQHTLTMLFSRIKTRNELISYLDHFEDEFFLYHENSEETLKKWYKKVEKYDRLLTEWEQEIVELLPVVERLVRAELAKAKSFYKFMLIYYFHMPIKPKI
jgi:hypothetical protein